MESQIIHITIQEKIAALASSAEYICGNSDYSVVFDFDEEWTGYDSKTARFCYNGKYADVVFTGSVCQVPIIFDALYFEVGVYAGNLHTTTPAIVPAKRSILSGKKLPENPEPNVYAQIMELLNSLDGDIGAAIEAYLKDHPLQETDPTVPAWAKNPKKPEYTAEEVGALPSTYTPPDQTAEQVGADPKGAAASAVGSHNTKTDAHNDLRLELKAINDRLNAFFDSDNQTLDELSEIVAYITSNKSLIDSITTSKVNVADIINNLTTNVSNKPLSAAQGVALKALIDAIIIPVKLSQLANDVGYITGYTETDPTVPAWAKNASKPSYNKSEVGLGNVDNVKQYSASNPPPYPVTSVNGQTGAVVIPIPTVPTKVSAFINDAGYLTEISKEEIVQQVIAALGTPVFGAVDADNNITLTGKLAEGKYVVKYEYADGSTAVVGTIDTSPGYTNMLLKAVEADDTPYNGGQGWKANTRLNSSGVESTSSATGVECTGFIPFKRGDVIRFKNIVMNKNANEAQSYFVQYDSTKTMIKQWVVSGFNGAINRGWVLTDNDGNILQINTGDIPLDEQYTILENAAYFRISANEINADSIITINQEIP